MVDPHCSNLVGTLNIAAISQECCRGHRHDHNNWEETRGRRGDVSSVLSNMRTPRHYFVKTP